MRSVCKVCLKQSSGLLTNYAGMKTWKETCLFTWDHLVLVYFHLQVYFRVSWQTTVKSSLKTCLLSLRVSSCSYSRVVAVMIGCGKQRGLKTWQRRRVMKLTLCLISLPHSFIHYSLHSKKPIVNPIVSSKLRFQTLMNLLTSIK